MVKPICFRSCLTDESRLRLRRAVASRRSTSMRCGTRPSRRRSTGYDPVRADQDTGALIITQMIERIYFADLVLADMTIPNGNVYYEDDALK
jgi:hypothetical protein